MTIGPESKSSTRVDTSNPVNNSDNGSTSVAQFVSTGKQSSVVQAGGLLIKKIGRGATVTFESTDHGAIASANSAIMAAINSQAGIASAGVMGLNELAETKVTDGANLNQKTTQLGIVIFGIIGAILAVVFFLKR